jgi:hypothetical protein
VGKEGHPYHGCNPEKDHAEHIPTDRSARWGGSVCLLEVFHVCHSVVIRKDPGDTGRWTELHLLPKFSPH